MLSLENFSKNKRKKDGLHYQCKPCHNLDYDKNKEKYKALTKIRNGIQRKLNRTFLNEEKNKPCMDCGIIYPPWIMDFDHRDSKTKLACVAVLARDSYALQKLKKEVKKCDLVCANCHRTRTHNRLVEKYGRVAQ